MKFQRPSFLYPLFSEITLIPGIGPKTFNLLENKIGKNVEDLEIGDLVLLVEQR